jgi:hypothetical protein
MTTATEQRTVDGVPVKVGDTVWCAHAHVAIVTTKRLEKHHLSMWWERLSKEIYSTERGALIGAIANQKQALRKAQQRAQRATKAIARLTARLSALETP